MQFADAGIDEADRVLGILGDYLPSRPSTDWPGYDS